MFSMVFFRITASSSVKCTSCEMSRKCGDSLSRRMQSPDFLITNPASRKVSIYR
jgi:adenylyl- and sulfurtransferase ThiI